MEYTTKKTENTDSTDEYRITLKDPIKFDFDDKQVKVTLYQIIEDKDKMVFFDSKEREQIFIKDRTITDTWQIKTLKYLGDFAGKQNVLYRLNRVYKYGLNQDFVIPCGNFAHKVLNIEKSKAKHKFIWEFRFGSLKEEYTAIYNALNHPVEVSNIQLEKTKSESQKEIDWSKEELWTTNDCNDYDKIGSHNRMVLQKNPRYRETINKK